MRKRWRKICALALASVAALLFTAGGALADAAFPPASTPLYAGVDVSEWQREVDWSAVYAAGVRIAYIRASEGEDYEDPFFRRNRDAARAAGLLTGFYHYMTARTPQEAERQADFFARVIDGAEPDGRLALDYGETAGLTDAEINANALAFLARLETAYGYEVLLYSDAWRAEAVYDERLSAYPLWVADYGAETPRANGKWSAWAGFQYSDQGRVDGITTRVDRDWFTAEVLRTGIAPPQPGPTPETGTVQYAVSLRNESMGEAAQRLGVDAGALAAMNRVSGDRVYNGQVLRYRRAGEASGRAFAGLYVVQAGDRLRHIAARFQTTQAELMAVNELEDAAVFAGQILRLPPIAGREDALAPSALLDSAHVVQPGQTLASIGRDYGIGARRLAIYNGLAEDTALFPGQVLRLRPLGDGEGERAYVVRRGDTLTRIAGRYGVAWRALYAANAIANPRWIYPGQIFVIP